MFTTRASRMGLAVVVASSGILTITAAPASAASYTPSYSLERNLKDSRIVESSGLARSTRFPGVMWTHNDSGDSPRVFAVGADGYTKAVVSVSGASAADWEDMAAGPDHTLWVGDIGDNPRSRSTISVYKFTEPTSLGNTTVPATRYNFRYPDGQSRDAEGMMVDPEGRLYIVSKSSSDGAIFRAPSTLSTSSTNTLTRVASAPSYVTAASWAPDGESFTLANYSDAWTYPSLGGTPVQYDKPSLRQGESLEYSADSSHILFGSEGSNSPVYATRHPSRTTAPPPPPSTPPPPGVRAFSLAPGEIETAAGPSRFLDGRAATSFTVPSSNDSGSGIYLGTMVRSTGLDNGYVGQVRFTNGAMELSISRRRSGEQVSLARVDLGSYTAGAGYRIVVRVTGTSKVTIQSRVRRLGQPVPPWQLTTVDNSSQRIATGGRTYASACLSSSATATKNVPFFRQR